MTPARHSAPTINSAAPRRLLKQSSAYAIPIETIHAEFVTESGLWLTPTGFPKHAEEVALAEFNRCGWDGCWCEGGTLNLLMKAASFPLLVKYNLFGDRNDARRRFFEAQCTILSECHDEILHNITTADLKQIQSASIEILSDSFVSQC